MAKRNYEMTSANYESLNKKALWFNLVIMAIAVASILTLLLTNFWKIKARFEMDESMLRDVFGRVSEGSEEEDSDLFNKLDFSKFNDLSIEVSLSLEPNVVLASITSGGEAATQKLVTSVISDLSRQASEILGEILKPLTKIVVSTVFDELEDRIKAELGDDFVENLNLDGVQDIVDMIVEGTTDTELRNAISNFIEKVAKDAGLEGEDLDKLMNGEAGEDSEGGVNKIVDEIVNSVAEASGATGESEEKTISFDHIIINLVGEALGVDAKGMSDEDRVEELSAYLVSKMPPETISIIHYIMIGLAVLLLMPVVAWGLLFLFGFIRIFTRKKILYMGLARGFGILPYILLVIIPWIGFMILNAALGSEFLMTGLSFGVSSIGLLVSFVGACVLALLKWCRYGRIKKQIKRAVITDEFDQFSAEYPGDSPISRYNEFSENSSNDYSNSSDDFNSEDSDKNFW